AAVTLDELLRQTTHERQYHQCRPKCESLKRQNVKITPKQELWNRCGSTKTKNERHPETQKQRAKPASGCSEKCGKRNCYYQHSVQHKEVIREICQVQQQVRSAGVRDRHLLDRVFDDGNPVGRQNDCKTNCAKSSKDQCPNNDCGSVSLLSSINNCKPQHRDSKQQRAKNQGYVVDGARCQHQHYAFQQSTEVGGS